MKTSLKGKTFKGLALCLLLLFFFGLFSACGEKQTEVTGEVKNLNYGISNAWDALMPYQSISGSNYSRIVYDKIYDRLAYVQADGTCLPRGADSWESAEDGYSIVFHLNENAKFHDGEPVTAEHWAKTMELMTNPACPTMGRTAFSALVGVDENGAQTGREALGVEALDSYTLKLIFKAPVIPEEFLVGRNREFYVLPTHLMEGVAPENIMEMELWKAPIGSGPMKFVSEISGSMLSLESNRDYHLGTPGFDTMTITVVDKANQLTALIAGDLDYYAFGNTVSEEDAVIAEEAGLSLIEGQEAGTFYELMLNNETIAKKELRQAISLSLDRALLAQQSAGSLGTPAISALMPGAIYAARPEPEDLARNLEEAKALVAEFYDGKTLTLACTSARASLAALMQQQLQEAGFQIEIMTVDSSTLFSGMYDGEYDMALASHTPNPLPLWFVDTRFREDNNLFRVGDLSGYIWRIESTQNCLDLENRGTIVQDLEGYLRDEMPFVPLFFVTPIYAQSRTVEGIDYPASSSSNENVWEWSLSE